ncbi:biopolymer transport protein ExbD [Dysgonomonas sp. PFB1-18]|uniref:ExbD/TolR family protein n=1 Tax=unclassified Dysgonomonas TaxID=2630389 RepID=UPI0024744E70|nr:MULTISPECIES: biopolymer transporter ExbD [unclassified Dysgonomonas]MDH6310843.1 biopolymer transport protein ExbD [Dysgonomonas sp. PF1-14]MDH6340719.1 biopolymer transport protein ExbD [Dysgonomonas sp. PF1-16]MDH6382313.1 biopolymer transport protein ExbD [Dysgonomonas sp. PFB1-18]MDH6399663.1 biopolymer transport protein ExbD [Dysgonomonas sp. PF1-23]
MKIERRKTRTAEVYTASLNDIMFFLLLFFLIISTMVTPAAIRVLLPNAATSEKVVTKKNINLIITRDLRYYINDKEVTKDQIEAALSTTLENEKNVNPNVEMNVLLQADKSLSLQNVVDIIDIGNKLKVKMVLFTQKPE